jgi:AI-2 transport protein TqsA
MEPLAKMHKDKNRRSILRILSKSNREVDESNIEKKWSNSRYESEIYCLPFNSKYFSLDMVRFAHILIVLFGVTLLLKIGQSVIFPIIFALLIYFLIRSFRRFYDRWDFMKNKVPSWVKNGFTAFLLITMLFFVVHTLVTNVQTLATNFVANEQKMDQTILSLNRLLGEDLTKELINWIHNVDVMHLMDPVISGLTSFSGTIFMMLFYLIFLFLEELIFIKKLKLITGTAKRLDDTQQLFSKMEHSITQYIGLKTLISAISGFVCFLIVLAFGVDSPFFWAFLIFVMNFLPVVGAIVAVFIPSLYAVVQFGDFAIPGFLCLSLGIVQALVGNLLEPRLMGGSLNISPFVALFALAFWGAVWGIIGMVVSVPLTVIIIILLAHFERTKPIAIFLSQNGEV